ncbi:MAG: glycogen/starch synthase [Halieaceae bacterium]|jgi:starch synthase|nr:glycogen/starch synthase [Halieaceae bacterium]
MQALNILMVAAENGALAGGKVGGMGDVLRDVPRALAKLGHRVTVVTPAYGSLHRLPRVGQRASVQTYFRGRREAVELHALPASGPGRRLRQFLLEHPLFANGGVGRIYCDDPPDQPFARDSSKFALFSAATAQSLLDGHFGPQDVVHLHDWHTGTFAVLVRCFAPFAGLRTLPLVLTIHNLAMQGIRPMAGDAASLQNWFPGLAAKAEVLDPRYPGCYNPMRAAINLCNKVHAVSPNYVREICDPDGDAGEGLQTDLTEAAKDGRLHGILNGCEYPAKLPKALPYPEFLSLARQELRQWIATDIQVRSSHLLAAERVEALLASAPQPPRHTLTLVGRLTDQKVGLLAQIQEDGRPLLAHLLDRLEDDERLVVLGSGSPDLERLFNITQTRDPRLLFLCGYSEPLSDQLYARGDLFLMPSRFEPCGIAQMLAMRAGQPCLVNRTGGLADTVSDEVTGFVFDGSNDSERGAAMLQRLEQALTILRNQPTQYQAMRDAAAAERFPWSTAAQAYTDLLYSQDSATAGA